MVSSKKYFWFLLCDILYSDLTNILPFLCMVFTFSTKHCQHIQALDQGHSVSSYYDSPRLPYYKIKNSTGGKVLHNFRSPWQKMQQIVFWMDSRNLMHTYFYELNIPRDIPNSDELFYNTSK